MATRLIKGFKFFMLPYKILSVLFMLFVASNYTMKLSNLQFVVFVNECVFVFLFNRLHSLNPLNGSAERNPGQVPNVAVHMMTQIQVFV